jgi:hypothetical protein
MVEFPAARVDIILRWPAFWFLVNKNAVAVLEEELAWLIAALGG